MDSVGGRLNLQEQGTRYNHYMELKEIFMLGLEVISQMNPSYVSDSDRAMEIKLNHAVELIGRRLEYLSDFTDKTSNYGNLAKEIRQAGKHVTPLLTDGRQNAENPNS